MKKIFISITLTLLSFNAMSQEITDEFKPSGKAFVKSFFNFNQVLTEGNENSAFELKRVYFGYKYKLSPNWSGKVTFDVGDPENGGKLHYTAYAKIASINYDNKKLFFDIGLIGMNQFSLQEKQWGYRYIEKSFQDKYKWGSSADLGARIGYHILEKMLSVDLTVSNGEGYKKLQGDNAYKTAARLVFKPIKGLSIAGYYDYYETSAAQTTIGTFAGYKYNDFSVGVEYNIRQNNDFDENEDLTGISGYANYKFLKKYSVFARLDYQESSTNIANDGNSILGGFEFSPVKNFKTALNYRFFQPSDSALPKESAIYINFEFKF